MHTARHGALGGGAQHRNGRAQLRRLGHPQRRAPLLHQLRHRRGITLRAGRARAWGVENRLHWRLDVVFGEDASRIRKGHAPAIMTSVRRLCMNLFEQDGSTLGLAKKRRKAAWNDDCRAKVVFG